MNKIEIKTLIDLGVSEDKIHQAIVSAKLAQVIYSTDREIDRAANDDEVRHQLSDVASTLRKITRMPKHDLKAC